MTRLADALMTPGTAFVKGRQNPVANPVLGGQMGHNIAYSEWMNSAAYVRRNLIPILLQAPKGFDLLPNPEKWYAVLRAMVELHPLAIEGLQAGLTVETVETPFGGAGEQMQHFTNVTRERSQPSFRLEEKYGRPFSNFLQDWITLLMMDPETKYAGISTLSGYQVTDMLPDMYSMTMAFIEPDAVHRTVDKAWIVTNMFPLLTGAIEGKRDITAAGENLTYDINFSGVAQFGRGVNAYCQTLLDSINITNANPNYRNSFVTAIDPSVLAGSHGYQNNVEALANNTIQV